MNVTKEKLCEMVYSSLNESLPGGEKSSEYTHKKIEIIVDEIFLGLAQNLKKKNPIEIRGFGRFYIAESKEKKDVTSELVRLLLFHLSSELNLILLLTCMTNRLKRLFAKMSIDVSLEFQRL